MGVLSSLSYDVNMYCFWVGLGLWNNNMICVYKYINSWEVLIGKFELLLFLLVR